MASNVVSQIETSSLEDPCSTTSLGSIQASAKTVIVLSPEFLSSDWCEYEIRMTLEADSISRKRILIPVMLRPCRVPDFIGRLTYIEVDNEHFWERFITALKQTDNCEVDVSKSGNYISRSGASSLQLPFHHNLDKLTKISLRENCDCCSDTSCDIVPNEISGSMNAEDFQNIMSILAAQQFVKRHAFFAWPSTCIPMASDSCGMHLYVWCDHGNVEII